MALTKQQELFCREYVARKFNATDAYMAAYPKSAWASAKAHGARLVANGNVQQRIAELTQQAAAANDVTPERVLRELAFIAFQRNSQVYRRDGTLKNPHEWDEATDATVSSVETEEVIDAADTDEEQEPQPHGGSLKRSKAKTRLLRTAKVKRWDKAKALDAFLKHFGLLKEDAPHPDREELDLSKLSDDAFTRIAELLAPFLAAGADPVLPT